MHKTPGWVLAAMREFESKPKPAEARVVFPDCHECPKPGHFHGKDCWALAEIAARSTAPSDGETT